MLPVTLPDDAMAELPSLRTMPVQARGRDKLARMLEVADRLIATEGADAITTTRIAGEAGISVGSVYRYLPNRGAIIEALAQHYLGRLEAEMDALVATLRDVAADRDVVGPAVDAFADFYRAHPGFRALWFGRHMTAEALELDRAHKRRMAERIRDLLVVRGLGGHDRRTLRVSQVIQLSTDAVMQEAFRTSPNGDKALLEQLKAMVRGYLAQLGG
jgi:AcrR family transcriptional regulator